MSVFTRNDKPEPNLQAAGTPKVETPPVQQPAAPRVQASAQPIVSHGSAAVPNVSVISKALKITGQLESTEDIQIEGQIDGDVRAASVKVGANAKVKGTVYGDTVELSGTIDGRIEARKVILTSTAHMSGDVVHQDIAIQSGAFIDGHCKPEYGKTAGASKPASSSYSSASSSTPLAAEKANGASAVRV